MLNKASVIIPTYKRPGQALNLVRSIIGHHGNFHQIIVIDQEHSTASDCNKFAEIGVEYFSIPLANTSAAKNLGIKKAKNEIVIFFDDDVEITKNNIQNHLSAYTENSIVGTAGRLINNNETLPENTNVMTGEINALHTEFTMNFWSTKPQLVDFPYGCNMSFRKEVLLKTGGFDEKYYPPLCAFEEIDLANKVRKFGNIKFIPNAFVKHLKAISGGTRTVADKNRVLYQKCYGRYLAKNVLFPVSLISLIIRSKSAYSDSIKSLIGLYQGYFSNILR